MEKKLVAIASLICLMACEKEAGVSGRVINEEIDMANVSVHVNDFAVSQEGFAVTRTDPKDVATYADVNAVTLAFYSGSTEVEKITQFKNDATTYTTFGEFECSLPMGSYTMVVVAYRVSDSSPFTLTSPTVASYTGAHAFDTFVATQSLNIYSTAAVDISATLSRVVSMLKVISTDGKAAGVTNVRMTFSAGGRSFNPTTGLATVNSGFDNTVGNSVAVGNTSESITYLFLATDEQEMDVTIETLDADSNILFTKTVEDVPFKRNRKTILTGPMYTNSGVGGSFTVSTDWLSDTNVNF